MKPTTAVLFALATVVASSEVVVKYSLANLVKGSEDKSSKANALSLARLAMESLALPEADVVAEPLPIVADFFSHTKAYGLILVEGCEDEIPGEKGTFEFQKTMSLDEASTGQIPTLIKVLAEGVKQKNLDNTVKCSGDVCKSVDSGLLDSIPTASAASGLWESLPLFTKDNVADVKFVEELDRLQQISKDIKSPSNQHAQNLYVFGISDLSKLEVEKRPSAAQAVGTAVKEFQDSLKSVYDAVGVQFLKVSGTIKIDVKALSAAAATSRTLAGVVALGTNSTNTTGPSPITVEAIAEYQIILWSSVILVVVLYSAISMLAGMDASRDNLLYAKFLTDANSRKMD